MMSEFNYQFKLDKHNPQRVYWLMIEVYDFLKNNDYVQQRGKYGNNHKTWNWEIKYGILPMQLAHGITNLPFYEKSIKRGDILQPIVSIDANVIDGRHKLAAYRKLNAEVVPIASPAGWGDGTVIYDEVYRPLIGDLIDIGKPPTDIICFDCGGKAKRNGVYFECECGRRVQEGLLGWGVPNLAEKQLN